MSQREYKVVTICGSMRYYNLMLEVAQDLTGQGYIVLMPFVKKGEGSTDIIMLDDMHKRKIDMSSGIVVVGSHRGESTISEIEYAKQQKKDIILCLWNFTKRTIRAHRSRIG